MEHKGGAWGGVFGLGGILRGWESYGETASWGIHCWEGFRSSSSAGATARGAGERVSIHGGSAGAARFAGKGTSSLHRKAQLFTEIKAGRGEQTAARRDFLLEGRAEQCWVCSRLAPNRLCASGVPLVSSAHWGVCCCFFFHVV